MLEWSGINIRVPCRKQNGLWVLYYANHLNTGNMNFGSLECVVLLNASPKIKMQDYIFTCLMCQIVPREDLQLNKPHYMY